MGEFIGGDRVRATGARTGSGEILWVIIDVSVIDMKEKRETPSGESTL